VGCLPWTPFPAGRAGRLLPRGEFFVAGHGRAGPCERRSRARAATSLRAHFVERERKPLGAKAAGPCDMPAQLANESFRADYVRFGNSVSAVMQVLMRSDIPAAEAFFRDHLRVSRPEILAATLQFLNPSAGLHSITSSARASNVAGTSRPSAFAVLRLMTRSSLVGCTTGRSAGFSPRRILAT
jgi:hypothetical protein